MSRIAVILFLALLVGCGIVVFLQLDQLERVFGPNQPKELGAKRTFTEAFVEALRSGEIESLAPVVATRADLDRLAADGALKAKGLEGLDPDALRADVGKSVLSLREGGGPSDIDWTKVRIDSQDDEKLMFLGPGLGAVGGLHFRIRCGRSVHELRVPHCARLDRGWVALSGIKYAERVSGSGCGPIDIDERRVEFVYGIESGRLPEAARAARIEATLDVVRRRLEALGFEGATPTLTPAGDVTFALPVMGALEEGWVIRSMLRAGTLAMRIEVLPDARYAERIADYGEPSPIARTGVWPDPEPGSFAAFKRAEIKRWVPDGNAYVPSDERFRLVKQRAADGSREDHFHVVEAAGTDGAALEKPRTSYDPTGRALVLFQIKEAQQDAFEAWTKANVGLPMALVIDGTYRTAPTIMAPLRNAVQVTMGAGLSAREQRDEARGLAALLSVEPLPLPLTFKSAERK